MFKLVCTVLQKLNIEWQALPKEMKLKCRTKIDPGSLEDDDEVINQYLRNNFIKFNLILYKVTTTKNKEHLYMMDISLFKGTPLVFMDFMDIFMKELYLQAQLQYEQYAIVINKRENILPKKKDTCHGH
mmetsp:Transcript_18544/g.17629  ORF Transcript_18544/g.17629 Transcript_18544/m.17629 type:complete len:129 (-) Transcript_18544:74-460(-)